MARPMTCSPASHGQRLPGARRPVHHRHSRAGGNPDWLAAPFLTHGQRLWIPAFAGMTEFMVAGRRYCTSGGITGGGR